MWDAYLIWSLILLSSEISIVLSFNSISWCCLIHERFIEVDIDKSMQRVLKRHIATGIRSLILINYFWNRTYKDITFAFFHFCTVGKPPDVAKWRVSFILFWSPNFQFFFCGLVHKFRFQPKSILQIEYNDRPNAETIIESKKNADLIIKSIDFWRWPCWKWRPLFILLCIYIYIYTANEDFHFLSSTWRNKLTEED